MIRDRIVVGMKKVKLSERLQLDENLTLNRAAQMVRQTEQVKQQQKELRGGLQDSSIEAIQRRYLRTKQLHKLQKHLPSLPQHQDLKRMFAQDVGISGKGPPLGRFFCTASEAICYKCNKGNKNV